MSDLVTQILGAVVATVLAAIIIATKGTFVTKPTHLLWCRVMRLRCRIFKKHSFRIKPDVAQW